MVSLVVDSDEMWTVYFETGYFLEPYPTTKSLLFESPLTMPSSLVELVPVRYLRMMLQYRVFSEPPSESKIHPLQMQSHLPSPFFLIHRFLAVLRRAYNPYFP